MPRMVYCLLILIALVFPGISDANDYLDRVDKRISQYKLSEESKLEAIKELKKHILSFAHLERKPALYGMPTNLYYEIDEAWSKLDDMSFFNRLRAVFAKQMDSHTRAYYPDYMSCREASFPIEFRFFRDSKKENSWGKVLVYKIHDKETFKNVNIGDELVRIENIEINKKNFDAMRKIIAQSKRGFYETIANSFLSHVYGKYLPMPARDKVYLVLYNYSTRQYYELEADWEYDYSKCKKADLYKGIEFPEKKEKRPEFTFMSNAYEFEKLPNPLNITEELFVAGIVQKKGSKNKYAYLKINNFKTYEDPDKDETINEFIDKALLSLAKLMNKFADEKVKGLILDLRHNPGGWVELAHHMVRVFSKDKVRSAQMQFSNGEMSLKHLVEERDMAEKERKMIIKKKLWSAYPYTSKFFNWNNYESAILDVRNSSLRLAHARPHFVAPADGLNPLGSSEDMPKVVLVDQFCVSSCDVFSAMIKDNKLGKVLGEATRGAGAMVYEGEIPLKGRLDGKKKIDSKLMFRYAYTNILTPDGEIIEDVGVEPDHYFLANAQNFMKGEGDGEWISQAIKILSK